VWFSVSLFVKERVMVKRIALVFLLLVATALIARVWADQGCPNCGQAWSDATGVQTGAGEKKGLVEAVRDIVVALQEKVAYCHANHGGATSEGDYQSAMADAQSHIDDSDLKAAAAGIAFSQGDGYMAIGNSNCPTNCPLSRENYATAEAHYVTASSFYSVAYDDLVNALDDLDTAIGYLVGEIDGHWCGCVFIW
jgi:hypothetical protein